MFPARLTFVLPACRRRQTPALGLAVGLVLWGAHACMPPGEACRRSRTCLPTGGTLGSSENWAGTASGGVERAYGGAAGQGGLGGLGGATDPDLPTEGTECSPSDLYACAGHATQLRLVCVEGVFEQYDSCPDGELCDTRPETAGLCQPAMPECEDQLPSDVVCQGKTRVICGADLLTVQDLDTCPKACFGGKCTECHPDAPGTCEPNSNLRRSCSAVGSWDVSPCPTEAPHCSAGTCGPPPSCAAQSPICGSEGSESCCASPVVPGGPFDDSADPWTMSSFRLDRFEVTVGRFRAFRAAWDLGWRPEVGSGKHVHLNGGLGFPFGPSAFEAGWEEQYLAHVDPSEEAQVPSGMEQYATWSETAGDDELRPVNFVNFYEAVAFCIWDGGFLPASDEQSYVARDGSAMRPYPWGIAEPGPDFELAVYGCHFPDGGSCEGSESIAPVGSASGESLFGQRDLSGNLAEWVLHSPTSGCNVENLTVPCGYWPMMPEQGGGAPVHGGAFDDDVTSLTSTSEVTPGVSTFRGPDVGFRCARPP